MVDRTDIDALLIGSLYGELSSADEARLRTHLESHPADRSALNGMVRTRDAVRASRLLEVQLEPPQSVSALLMQEAHRRAPRAAREESEGWFARLRRSLMSPAMAAAAMLVLVVGVAGTMYMRKGDHFATPTLSSSEGEGAKYERAASMSPAPSEPAAGSGAAGPSFRGNAAAPSGADDVQSNAREEDGYRVKLAEPSAAADRPAQALRKQDEGASIGALTATPAPAAAAQAPAPDPAPDTSKAARGVRPTSGMLEVTTPQRAPKDLDESVAKNAEEDRAESAPPRAPQAAPPPPPAAVLPATVDRAGAPSEGTKAKVAAPGGGAAAFDVSGGESKGDADADTDWARTQHARLRELVVAGQCREAANVAAAVSMRARGYYQQNIDTDRSVKTCISYIHAEVEKVDQARARAASRRTDFEDAAPAKGAKSAGKPPPKAAPAKAAPPSKPAAADQNRK